MLHICKHYSVNVGHENMDLRNKLEDLTDINKKCSEINHAMQLYGEKYNCLVMNLPAFKEESDLEYLIKKINELESRNSALEQSLQINNDKSRALEQANAALNAKTAKYKSDVKKIAKIVTQQEELIKKYEL